MVLSNIDNNIEYEETRSIDKHDVDDQKATYVYRGRIFNQDIKFVLGKPKFENVEQNIVHFNIYLVKEQTILGRMGVYEVRNTIYSNLLDEDGNIIIEKLDDPLIFDFTLSIIRENFDESYVVDPKKDKNFVFDENESDNDSDNDSDDDSDNDSDNDIGKMDDIPISKPLEQELDPEYVKLKKQLEEAKEMLKKANPKLQTQEDAYEEMTKYKMLKEDKWINKFLRSKKYSIVDNEGGGDCFFSVMRDALTSLSSKYDNLTVATIRSRLAQEVTEDIFQHYKELYDMVYSGINDSRDSMKEGKTKHSSLKKMIGGTSSTSEKQELLAAANANLKSIGSAGDKLKQYSEGLEELKFMKDIKTIDDLKESIRIVGGEYWADVWAISTLERIYNVKFIILAKDYFNESAVNKMKISHPLEYLENNDILQCGDFDVVIEQKIRDGGNFDPDYYIICEYHAGIHYRLITYDKNIQNDKYAGQSVFKFNELPYIIKELVLHKCMQKEAGAFYIIPDFKHFALENHVEMNEPEEPMLEAEKSSSNAQKLYYENKDEKIVLQISKNAGDEKKKIANGKRDIIMFGEYYSTSLIKKYGSNMTILQEIKNWRQKLMNTYMGAEQTIEMDSLKWPSVQHYIYAMRFIGVPEIYKMFTSESGHEAAESIVNAKKLYDTMLKDKHTKKLITKEESFIKKTRNITIDALRHKFTKNEEMRKLLLASYPAKIMIFISGNSPKIEATELMMVRKELHDLEKTK